VLAEGTGARPLSELSRLREYVYPHDTLIRAVVRMNAIGARQLPVVEKGSHLLRGMLTMSDIFRAQAEAAQAGAGAESLRETFDDEVPPSALGDPRGGSPIRPGFSRCTRSGRLPQMVDVLTEIEIARPRERVAAYAADPSHAPDWYVNIRSVEWQTPPPVKLGSRMAFVAHFLGRRLSYTYEIVELVPGERLVMRTAEGPFPMETTYMWQGMGSGSTRMTLRNRGQPSGFSKLAAPFLAAAMRRANQKDLKRLKAALEAEPAPSASAG